MTGRWSSPRTTQSFTGAGETPFVRLAAMRRQTWRTRGRRCSTDSVDAAAWLYQPEVRRMDPRASGT